MKTPICHRTIGPSQFVSYKSYAGIDAEPNERTFEALPAKPRPCLGSACVMWEWETYTGRAEVSSTVGRCVEGPWRAGQGLFTDPNAAVDEDAPRRTS